MCTRQREEYRILYHTSRQYERETMHMPIKAFNALTVEIKIPQVLNFSR